MSRKLAISEDLSLPIDAVTQTFAILAKRRAGKSYTMRRLAEQFLNAQQQVVIVDPKGDQWGIRSSADGQRPGYPVIILGGERGDVPLEAGAGEIVAKLVVEERVSALLDLSLFRKHEVATFMTGFLENLYRMKAREAYRTPMMLIIDEADAVAPQKPMKNELRMLGAAEDIVRRGGQRGIGCILVTQRSAVLNKNVLTQSQILVALRTIAPQDRRAMDAWVEVHGEPEQHKLLMDSLASLPTGDAWFWSPGWPTTEGIFKRVHVSPIETFDSGATPKAGEKPVEPRNLADVDLDALKRQMSATIEKAKENDPAELKRTIADLKRKLAQAERSTPEVKQVEVEVPVLGQSEIYLLNTVQKMCGDAMRQSAAQTNALEGLHNSIVHLRITATEAAKPILRQQSGGTNQRPTPVQGRHRAMPSPTGRSAAVNGELRLPPGEKAILIAAAQREGCYRDQLSVLTGYKRSSRDAYIARLKEKGFITIEGELIHATEPGISALGSDYQPLPTGDELQRHWMERLPPGERAILQVLLTAYPDPVNRDCLKDATEYQRSSRDAYLQRLKARRLVEIVGRGEVRAAKELFE